MKKILFSAISALMILSSCEKDDTLFVKDREVKRANIETFFTDKAFTNTKNTLLISLANYPGETSVELNGDATFYQNGKEITKTNITGSTALSFIPQNDSSVELEVILKNNNSIVCDTIFTLSLEDNISKKVYIRPIARINQWLSGGSTFNRYWFAPQLDIISSEPLMDQINILNPITSITIDNERVNGNFKKMVMLKNQSFTSMTDITNQIFIDHEKPKTLNTTLIDFDIENVNSSIEYEVIK